MYDSEWCLISSITSPAATSENPNFCSQIDQPTLRQMQQKSEKQKMKKKIEQERMKDQKKQINLKKKKRRLRKMKRSREKLHCLKQDLPSPLFEASLSFISLDVMIANGLANKSMERPWTNQGFSPLVL